jgi:hypothetical protein
MVSVCSQGRSVCHDNYQILSTLIRGDHQTAHLFGAVLAKRMEVREKE